MIVGVKEQKDGWVKCPIPPSTPVQVNTRKLRAKWSLEASADIRSLHGLEAEVAYRRKTSRS
jgi:hypothetical protein